MDYDALKALHSSSTPFAPLIPVSVLPSLALILLAATFALAFYFSTQVFSHCFSYHIHANTIYSLPKSTIPVKELAVASTASILGGFGVVALFCTAGVYV